MDVSQTVSYEAPETSLYYELSGSGDPVVFIHGFSLDHRMWRPQVEHLSGKYRTLTYDVRGFGRSSLPVGPYNHAADLDLLLTRLGISSAHIVGLSMGGRIAVNFALEYPESVRSLALLDSALDGYPDTVNWGKHPAGQTIQQAKAAWLGHKLFAPAERSAEVSAGLKDMVAVYSGWHWFNRDAQVPGSTRAVKRLGEIHARSLVMVGELDLDYFRNIAKFLHQGIRGSHLEVVPGVGHMVNLEAPIATNDLLDAHLAA